MIVMGAGTNHWFHSDQTYRAMLDAGPALRLPGRQRRRLGALRRPGEGAADHRLLAGRLRARLEPPAAPAGGDAVLVPGHRPVALRGLRRPTSSRRRSASGDRWQGAHFADLYAQGRAAWAGCRPTRASTATRSTSRRRPRPRASRPPTTSCASCRRGACASPPRTPDAPENFPRVLTLWRANLLGSSSKGHEYFLKHLLGVDDLGHPRRRVAARAAARRRSCGATRRRGASSTCSSRSTSA